MDPLSISTGILTVLTACITVSVELKRLKQCSVDAAIIINALLTDVNSLRTVLQLMETTFEEIEARDEFESTGHIGSHWHNLNQSLQDGHDTLTALDTLSKSLNRSVAFLDGPRRYHRLQAASGQIASFRQQIQTYKDAMQFSLQTITFWNSVKIKNDTTKILPTLESMEQNIYSLASTLTVKLQSLQDLFERPDQHLQREAVERLSKFVKSAETVYSSAASIIQESVDDVQNEPIPEKDWVNNFQSWEANQDVKQWVHSQDHDSVDDFWKTEGASNGTGSVYPGMPQHNRSQPDGGHTKFQPPQRMLSEPTTNVVSNLPRALASSQTLLGNANTSLLQIPEALDLYGRNQWSEPYSQSHSALKRKARYKWFRKTSSQLSISDDPSSPSSLITTSTRSVPSSPSRLRHTSSQSAWQRKFVFVGDGACGKTCFLNKGSKGAFPHVYIPTVFENYMLSTEIDGNQVNVELWDTAGQDDYDRLRPLSYPDTHLTFICFAIDCPDSLSNVQAKWATEVSNHLPKRPIMLLGCKMDLRNDAKRIGELLKRELHPVTHEEGCNVARTIGAFGYVECSAKTGEGVDEAFEIALRATLSSETGFKRPSPFKTFFGLMKS